MKKIVIAFSTLFIIFASTSCRKTQDDIVHEHEFSQEWSSNESSHWHTTTCEHNELVKDLADHIDSNHDNKCDVCNYNIPILHEHTFSTTWSTNESSHWHTTTCEHSELVKDFSNHIDANHDYVCDVCGYNIDRESYMVVWKNYDDSIIEIDNDVLEGTTPTCSVIPERYDETYLYNFTGWTPQVTTASKNIIYKACFEKDETQFRVTFKDDEGNVLNTQLVKTGEYPDLTLVNTDKELTGYVCEFEGWDKEVSRAYKNETYKAQYDIKPLQIEASTVAAYFTFGDEDGLGNNFSFDHNYVSDGELIWNMHCIHVDGVLDYGLTNYLYETYSKLYMDDTAQYDVEIVNNIPTNPRKTSMADVEYMFDYYLGNLFNDEQDAVYNYDSDTGLYISDTSYGRFCLGIEDGVVVYAKYANHSINAGGVYDTYDEVTNITKGTYDPIVIPDYEWSDTIIS